MFRPRLFDLAIPCLRPRCIKIDGNPYAIAVGRMLVNQTQMEKSKPRRNEKLVACCMHEGQSGSQNTDQTSEVERKRHGGAEADSAGSSNSLGSTRNGVRCCTSTRIAFGHNVERQGTGAEQALHENVSMYTKVNTTRTSQKYLKSYNVIWYVFLKAWTAVDDHDMKTSLTGWAWNAQILKQQVLFAENCYLLPKYLLPAISSSQPSPF